MGSRMSERHTHTPFVKLGVPAGRKAPVRGSEEEPRGSEEEGG